MIDLPHDEVCSAVPGVGWRGPTFSHVLCHPGIRLMELCQDIPVVVGGVAMPSHSINVVTGSI